MKKSNIFAFIELSKLVQEIQPYTDPVQLKSKLKSQAAYFNIIDPKYFSEDLYQEWKDIQWMASRHGRKMTDSGELLLNSNQHTFDLFSEPECVDFKKRICFLFEKVQKEFL